MTAAILLLPLGLLMMALSVAEVLFEACYLSSLSFLPFRMKSLTTVPADPPTDGAQKRKKRSRWGDTQENKAAGLMGLPTLIMANFTNEQLEAYTLHLRIEEISQKLRINDVVPADGDR